MAKPLKRANGSGAIIKASGNRRKPYQVIVTVGWDDNGKQIRKSLGYFETRDKATVALASYNENPYDISAANATFKDVYEKWSRQKFPTISDSNINGIKAAYSRCESIYDKKFKDIGVDDLQYVIDNADCNYPTLKKIKSLLSQIFGFAVPRKLTDRDYSEAVDIEKFKDKNPNKRNRHAFTTAQIEKIRMLDSEEMAKTVLMLIYSGMRIGEFLSLKKADCHLDEHYVDVVSAKTENGIRKVPISDKTIEYWKYFYDKKGSEYLVSMDGRDFSENRGYTAYKDTYWSPFMETLGFGKRDIHETRHTCSTLLYSAEVYEAKIARILGHTGKAIADKVYTHLDVKELVEAINKI
ncbi:MAG: tyrosine-type recombinase/integrase [Lachnospiraceae bacterium]|nr:tyrosine-type recombinase/integrase [Lachnospiraceae bacterium]